MLQANCLILTAMLETRNSFFFVPFYGKNRPRDGKEVSRRHTACKGGSTCVCLVLCNRVFTRNSTKWKRRNKQINKVYFPPWLSSQVSVGKRSFQKSLFLWRETCCRYSNGIKKMSKSRVEADTKSDVKDPAVYTDDVSAFLVTWRDSHTTGRAWEEFRW